MITLTVWSALDSGTIRGRRGRSETRTQEEPCEDEAEAGHGPGALAAPSRGGRKDPAEPPEGASSAHTLILLFWLPG